MFKSAELGNMLPYVAKGIWGCDKMKDFEMRKLSWIIYMGSI